MLEKSSLLRSIASVIALSTASCESTEEKMGNLLAEADHIVVDVRNGCVEALKKGMLPFAPGLLFASTNFQDSGGCYCRNWDGYYDERIKDEHGFSLMPIGCTFSADRAHSRTIFDASRRGQKEGFPGIERYTARARAGHVNIALSSTLNPTVCELTDRRSGNILYTADDEVVERCVELRQKIRTSIQKLAGIAKQKLEPFPDSVRPVIESELDRRVIEPLNGTY